MSRQQYERGYFKRRETLQAQIEKKLFPVAREKFNVLKEYYNLPLRGITIVDLGCGEGSFSALASSKGAIAIMVDWSREALTLAARNTLNPDQQCENHAILADAQNLPIKTAAIDVVVLSDVLEHIQTPESLLNEANRVLKSGRGLYLVLPNAFGFFSLTLDLIDRAICQLKRKIPHHVQQFTKRKITQMLSQSEFEIAGCKAFKVSQIVFFNKEIKLPRIVHGYLSIWRKFFWDEWMLWAVKK